MLDTITEKMKINYDKEKD